MKPAEIFRMLSDATRLRLLALILREKDICVCEFVQALDLSQPRVSRHLALLKEAGIVTSYRYAQWVFYQINPDLTGWRQQVLSAAFVGLRDEPIIHRDATRLYQMKDRPARPALHKRREEIRNAP